MATSRAIKPDTSFTKVFRAIVARLETDPGVRHAMDAKDIRSWKGVPGDKAPPSPSAGAPVIRLTPNPSGVDWYDPSSQMGTLAVQVEMAVASLNIDDVANLWGLIVVALSSSQPGFALALVALGAETGEIVFSDPAYDPKPSASPEGYFAAAGHFHLAVGFFVN